MSPDERAHLRALIDEARRALVRVCEHCGAEIPEDVKSNRFCSRTHQRNAWRRTEKGREQQRRFKRQKRERQRMATA